jgi:hypothetical protein
MIKLMMSKNKTTKKNVLQRKKYEESEIIKLTTREK